MVFHLVIVSGAHVAVRVVVGADPAVSEGVVGIVNGRDGPEASFRQLVVIVR